jgi:hypothetical protein
VLSIGKLMPGQHDYYLDTVTRCAEEYYRSRARPKPLDGGPGPRLGAAGDVSASDLAAVLDGPGRSECLWPCRRARRPRARQSPYGRPKASNAVAGK